jgi:hypothetical protein
MIGLCGEKRVFSRLSFWRGQKGAIYEGVEGFIAVTWKFVVVCR